MHLVIQHGVADGAEIAVRVVSTDDGAANFRCRRARNKLTIESDGKAKCLHVHLRSVRAASAIANCKSREVRDGLLFDWLDPAKPLTFSLE